MTDCLPVFKYALDPNQSIPISILVNMPNINRVAAGLINGRIFLLDSTITPVSSVSAEGSFVLAEINTGDTLASACIIEVDGKYVFNYV